MQVLQVPGHIHNGIKISNSYTYFGIFLFQVKKKSLLSNLCDNPSLNFMSD